MEDDLYAVLLNSAIYDSNLSFEDAVSTENDLKEQYPNADIEIIPNNELEK